LAGEAVVPDAGPLVDRMPAARDESARPEIHPLAHAQEAALETVRSREQALERSYFPRVNFQTTFFARGAVAPALTGAGGDGLLPDTSNWGAGLTFTFPVFDIFGIRARHRVEVGNESAEQARYAQVVQALRADDARARAQLEAARLIADNTPIELNAAQEAETRARSRYEAGLAPLTELADAERLLAQAEIDEALARVAVWQALLAESAARGDLTPFLEQLK
jgi:outer membrane protein TolC